MSKYVLITGGSGGIGLEFAKLYAKDKCNLILVARNASKLEEIKKEMENTYNIEVITYSFDLTNEENIDALYNDLKAKNINIDILINNAGFAYHSFYVESDYSRQKDLVQLNILTLMKMSYLFGNDMKNRKSGSVLNIASVASYLAGPYATTYYASKAYVMSFTEGLAEELKEYNVFVGCICPGPTKTNFEKEAKLEDSKMFKSLPVSKPEYIAKIGYKAIKKRRVIKNCGPFVGFSQFLTRMFPRILGRKFSKKINRKPNN